MIPYSISKSGLHAQQTAMDITANDLANLNTTGYKGKNMAFRELLNNAVTPEDVLLGEGVQNAAINRGVKSAAVGNDMRQTSLVSSDGDFHLAIAGEGFFGIQTADGLRLTRDGSFSLNGAGNLVNAHGERVDMTEFVPASEWPNGHITVSETGEILIKTEAETILAGQIRLYRPANPEALQPTGRNQFQAAGQAVAVSGEGAEGFGKIQQHTLETSNVQLAQAMIQLMTAQRAYSLNLKAVQSTDDLYSIMNQFNRS